MKRRFLMGAGAALAATSFAARAQHSGHGPALRPAPSSPHPFHNLFQGGAPHHLTPDQRAQRVSGSPAPAGTPGRWVARADMPIPRSEMAWATAWNGRMHVVGGYGEGRVNRAYHTVYDPAADAWLDAAPLPRGANHVAVAADAGRVYALGGFIEQNRRCDDKAFAYEVAEDRWREIAPLPRPRGAAAAVVLAGRVDLHLPQNRRLAEVGAIPERKPLRSGFIEGRGDKARRPVLRSRPEELAVLVAERRPAESAAVRRELGSSVTVAPSNAQCVDRAHERRCARHQLRIVAADCGIQQGTKLLVMLSHASEGLCTRPEQLGGGSDFAEHGFHRMLAVMSGY